MFYDLPSDLLAVRVCRHFGDSFRAVPIARDRLLSLGSIIIVNLIGLKEKRTKRLHLQVRTKSTSVKKEGNI